MITILILFIIAVIIILSLAFRNQDKYIEFGDGTIEFIPKGREKEIKNAIKKYNKKIEQLNKKG